VLPLPRFLTVETRRSHQLAPFVRWEPGTMSEIGILRQLKIPSLGFRVADDPGVGLAIYQY
jgi:hypothetical protein